MTKAAEKYWFKKSKEAIAYTLKIDSNASPFKSMTKAELIKKNEQKLSKVYNERKMRGVIDEEE